MDYESKHVLSCFIVGKNGHPLSSIIKNMVNPNMMAFTIHPDFFRGLTMTYHDTHDQTRLVIPIAISQGKNIAAWTGNPVSGTPNITKNSYNADPSFRQMIHITHYYPPEG